MGWVWVFGFGRGGCLFVCLCLELQYAKLPGRTVMLSASVEGERELSVHFVEGEQRQKRVFGGVGQEEG